MVRTGLYAPAAGQFQLLFADIGAGNLAAKSFGQVTSGRSITAAQIQEHYVRRQRNRTGHDFVGVFHCLRVGAFFAAGNSKVKIVAPSEPVDLVSRPIVIGLGTRYD